MLHVASTLVKLGTFSWFHYPLSSPCKYRGRLKLLFCVCVSVILQVLDGTRKIFGWNNGNQMNVPELLTSLLT